MADKLENAVRYFLQPSEDVKITLETLIVGKRTEEDDGKNQRILAVVTHQNEAGEEREGRCVFYRLRTVDRTVHHAMVGLVPSGRCATEFTLVFACNTS
jgi:hypothetical protein